ncbi:2-C-methyl-D-erythritol 4-phosphate cytidylyltransferase [filamentous cyanobacterium LEGE 11480]|uniref:2-C-methyl-D-erythritol 4-phosphate cytidylyltransferase n=1 Tax=Romeriopsis navalis LEGE 11480 TaxID=2777977 RepID=A0A928VV97_9CYAN|nr:2-C-methyl-D-erythritol 4-phosphate cytidylyltransferase [Romeriopsis navalis]MBE9032694.1 2-C-methyl-D-erythritol 4-phosphate cytidylyltransferase [Romeriopsis navalis LEGE 11480]
MYLLIPAAGSGKRMGSEWQRQGKAQRNKLLLDLIGKPVLAWTLLAAEASSTIEWIGIMGQPIDFDDFNQILADLNLRKPVTLIQGGSTRQESVYNGLQALPTEAQHVLIHDGARCLATPELFDRCSASLKQYDGLVAAVAVKDTIKVVDETMSIQDTPDRANLWAAQTPQGFSVPLLKQSHDEGKAKGWEVTDDAALFERCGLPVYIVPGEETNLKVTTPVDLAIAQFILQGRTQQSES